MRLTLVFFLLTFFQCSQAAIIYVDANATIGNQDGTSWADAYTDLQDALVTAEYGDEIWVAAGVYHPTPLVNRSISFVLKNGVGMYGGFMGFETNLSERNPAANKAVLSGDIGVQGDSTDNSYSVVLVTEADSTTVLDGFTIVRGNADSSSGLSSSQRKSGGGLYFSPLAGIGEIRLKILNCVFESNFAKSFGGAVYMKSNSDASVTPYFYSCTFFNNNSNNGGGVYKSGASLEFDMHFVKCNFEDNFASNGGGFYYDNNYGNKNIIIDECRFEKNNCLLSGGGIYQEVLNVFSKILISNSNFRGNFTLNFNGSGLAIACLNFSPANSLSLYKCSFTEHNGIGTAIITLFDCVAEVESCKFIKNHLHANTCFEYGFILNSNNVFLISNNVFARNEAIGSGGVGFSSLDVKFINCTLIQNKGENSIISSPFVSNNLYELNNSIICKNTVNHSGFFLDSNGGTSNDTLAISNTLLDHLACTSLSDGSVTCGPGNLYNLDPLFLDTAAGDFRLHPCSPARNAGDNTFINQLGTSTDINGDPRIQEGTVDMGAYEIPAFGALLGGTSPADCHGESTGAATLSVQSGCGPFTVTFGGASTFTDSMPYVLDGLPAGTLDITVNDSEGRSEDIQVTIGQPPLLEASASATPVDCGESTHGTATASITGGTPGMGGSYDIQWSNGTGGPTASLPSGGHTLQVTDSLGCVAVDSFTVEAVGQLAVAADSTGISCHPADGNGGDGTATASPNGLAPYTWLWQDGQTTETIAMLQAGTYSATVTDALGCTGTATITLTAPDSIALSIEATDILCQGAEDGFASVSAYGGTMPYSFLWQNGATDSLLIGIGSGQYALTLTDGNGCTSSGSIEVFENTLVELDTMIQHATGAMETDGAIFTDNPQGGIPPYTYLWETGDTTASIGNIPPYSYELTVTDSLGCETVFTFLVDFEVATSEALKGVSISAWPVPARAGQVCWLRLESQKQEVLQLRLVDATGRVLQKGEMGLNAGELLHHFTAPTVAGHYWLVAESTEGGRAVLKLVIL